MLELKKITKVYETESLVQQALNNISIMFRANEFVSILGQSGSGKTTLLNIIGGLDQYSSGDLIINGISTKEYKDRDWDTYRNHRVGFVFQSYNLIPHQTALQNVELALTLSGIGKEERRKRSIDVLKKVGLKDQIYKRPNQMSGGQMQRVAIARALVNDPDILLADEPTGALDSETSIQIMNLLKEIAKDKLVIMVTHNPDLANQYSTRIVKLLDGKIVSDSNPFNGKEETVIEEDSRSKNKSKKTSMSFFTAFSLSLNNLMTKKGRTILTAFAGSIGIIGIAAILSLSHGIQLYIDKTEKETLSSYPLMISKESVDMSSMLTMFSDTNSNEAAEDGEIGSVNIMGDLLTTMSSEVKRNDLKEFKKFIEDGDGKKINDYVSSISYGYDVTLNLYKHEDNKNLRVNPTSVFDALGMSTDGISSIYSSYMSNYDVFYEMLNNEDLLKQEFELVAGSWPEAYNEVVLTVDKNNLVSDYTLYSLGLLDQNYLQQQFYSMVMGNEVEFERTSYKYDEIIGLEYKLLLNSDLYVKKNNVWVDMSKDQDYLNEVLNNSIDIKIVGIIKPDEESVASSSYGMVGYRHDLVEYMINKTNESDIVKEQLNNPEVNVFTGNRFDLFTENNGVYYSYEENLKNLGYAKLDDPDYIYIYPTNFDSKEEIEKIIDEFNEGKDEDSKLTYTDVVGIMMSSVSSIVNVISSVLIAFVAISLIVSSIMISIITYISVLERIKEIGILRAIGASKKDISRVFNAETLIEGLCSGILGIVVTALLIIPANIIIKNKINISGLCVLPVDGAILLIVISVILTVLAGFIPSKLASKKDPVIALRSE